MTPHLRYARGLTAAAILSSATAAYLATTSTPLWSLPVVYIAALLAWCGQRDYAAHRRVLVEHELARRALYSEQLDVPTAELNAACCTEGFVSQGTVHEATCTTRTARSSAA